MAINELPWRMNSQVSIRRRPLRYFESHSRYLQYIMVAAQDNLCLKKVEERLRA